jgi:hypothetical protein
MSLVTKGSAGEIADMQDTVMTWASLEFQPEFTATAANIGYGQWSHDIGGHMRGIKVCLCFLVAIFGGR